jgi:hypothetical protein
MPNGKQNATSNAAVYTTDTCQSCGFHKKHTSSQKLARATQLRAQLCHKFHDDDRCSNVPEGSESV